MPNNTFDNKDDKAANADFSQCHANIISNLMAFSGLPALMESSARVRKVAEQAMVFFRGTVHEHHSDEEWDLFPAVLAGAEPGDEFEWVKSMIERLTLEHRHVESMWARMEPDLQKIADGEPAQLDASVVQAIVLDYGAHAAYEEAEFLPICRTILARKHGLRRSQELTLAVHPTLMRPAADDEG